MLKDGLAPAFPSFPRPSLFLPPLLLLLVALVGCCLRSCHCVVTFLIFPSIVSVFSLDFYPLPLPFSILQPEWSL